MAFEMHSPIFLASLGWIQIGFWILLCFAFAVPLFVIKYGRKKVTNDEKWLTDVIVPVMTSVVVALVGIGFALESSRRQRADAEADQQTSLMRDLMISQDRREAAHFFALHLNLGIHLNRYMQMVDMPQDPALDKRIGFEEEAIFYFYLKHRAALVNLRASKGNLIFRRVWMENVFEQLAIHLVETILGARERDPNVSAEGEAATYRLFAVRGPALSETNDEPKRPEGYHLGGYLVLSDFHRLMNDESTIESQDPDVRQIKTDFGRFQKRLHNGDEKPPVDPFIDKVELINSIRAMQGLVAYSYQNLLLAWYQLDEHEIPTHAKCLPEKAPKPFLNLMWYDFERLPPRKFTGTRADWEKERMEMWKKKRQDAWELILKLRPQEAQAVDCPRRWLFCGEG